MIEFKILKKSINSGARLGILKTQHGEVETPALVPVATQAVIKTLTSDEVLKTKSQILICNTFHLHLKPGEKIIKASGGLHKFMQWSKPLMTDSGGFQVFSLGFGKDFQVKKLFREKQEKKSIKFGAQPQSVKITEEGIHFRSPIDGRKIFIGPRESIKIQEALGADIIYAFDECTAPNASRAYTLKSLEKTHAWAKICLEVKKSKQAIFGITQGGRFKDLRRQSAKFIGSLPFNGFGIGGEFGYSKKIMTEMIRVTLKELPKEKPRHMLGIGHPEDIPLIIKEGIDTFDCIVPTHYARRGIAFTSMGKLNLNKSRFLKDRGPVDKKCACETCQTYSRSYIMHLLKAKEITALRLLTFHNLFWFNNLVEQIRNRIKNGKL